MRNECTTRFLDANGVRFACLECGEGPLVLCLHGFPDTARGFEPVLGQLAAAGFHAVAPFMRGYAPSGLAPDGDYSAPALARDVLALIEALCAEDADVIGHDWGAYAAYCAANLDARRIRRLVLMGVPHIAGATNSLRQWLRSWYIWFFQLPRLPERRVARDGFAFIDRLYRDWSPGWTIDAEALRPVKDALAAPGGLAAAISYYRAMFRNSNRQTWALLSARTTPPTLMLAGAQDGAVGAEVFGRSQQAFTGPFAFCLLPDVGHFMHREQPEIVGARIVAFLCDGNLSTPA